MEKNPFKTIKLALVRQNKATKNEEKSKTVANQEPNSKTDSSGSTTKPKICTIKRVALVKFSPVRRSFRGLTSASRHSMSSPKPGRRKGYLDTRRKSPKVRRRCAERDDSSSTSSARASIDIAQEKMSQSIERMRFEDKMNNNNTTDYKISQTLDDIISNKRTSDEFSASKRPVNATSEVPTNKQPQSVNSGTNTLENRGYIRDKNLGKNTSQNDTLVRAKKPGRKTSDSATHFNTNEGVVLKRESSAESCKIDYAEEKPAVQHHVLHERGITESIVKGTGCERINEVDGGEGNGPSNVKLANAEISCVAKKASEATEVIQPP